MLKKVLFALVPMVMLVGTVKADDSLFNISLAEVTDADNMIEEVSLDGLDVDQLASEAGESDEAIEACFRRFGYRRHAGYGYGYNHYRYNYGHYNYCYRPAYRSYYCYKPVVYTTYCYRPVHYVQYWGCY